MGILTWPSMCIVTRASTCVTTRASTRVATRASTCVATRASSNCLLLCASTCSKARASTCVVTRASTCVITRASLLFKNMPPGALLRPSREMGAINRHCLYFITGSPSPATPYYSPPHIIPLPSSPSHNLTKSPSYQNLQSRRSQVFHPKAS